MAGTAVGLGATAASQGTGSGGHFSPAFKAESRELFFHFAAFAMGTLHLLAGIENDPLKIFLTTLTMKFENWHNFLPSHEIITTAPGESKDLCTTCFPKFHPSM